jgi:DNA-binding MarR family transcriptional regulator
MAAICNEFARAGRWGGWKLDRYLVVFDDRWIMRRPRRLRKSTTSGVRGVVEETIALYHRMRWISEQVYGDEGRSTARRGILRGLVRYGAQTVPGLARARSVTRQHVQEVVDALLEHDLVALEPNPAHKRSPLVRATEQGEALVREMDEIDAGVLGAVSSAVSPRDMEQTARTLRTLRNAFEVQSSRWRRS